MEQFRVCWREDRVDEVVHVGCSRGGKVPDKILKMRYIPFVTDYL